MSRCQNRWPNWKISEIDWDGEIRLIENHDSDQKE